MIDQTNILITGSHRSGSTWTGKMIALSNETGYVHEPMNHRMTTMNPPFDHWFDYVDTELSDGPHLKRLLDYMNVVSTQSFKSFFRRLGYCRKPRSVAKLVREYLSNRNRNRLVIKDPIAIFQAEWFYKTLNTKNVVLIRHPAAFISSLKNVDFRFDFDHFTKQPLLMERFKDYESEINEIRGRESTIVEQGIILWNLFHDKILEYQTKYEKEWYFIKYEDLATDPVLEFEKIYSYLSIPYSEEVRNEIARNTSVIHSGGIKGQKTSNTKKWRSLLSDQEIASIKAGTASVCSHFYSESDW